ncbi:MAG: 3'-5' exonuclease, partial [Candidatus Thorarchaeota archaeon]
MGKNDKSDEDSQSSLEDFFGGSEADNSKSNEQQQAAPEEPDDSKSEPPTVIDESPSGPSPPNIRSAAVFTVDDEDDLSIHEEEIPIDLRVGSLSTPKNLPPSILLSVDYDGAQNKAVARLYDPETKEIHVWFDNTNHKPYCYTDLPAQTVESMPGIRNNRGFLRAESVELVDLLRDRPVTMTKVIATDPLSIGGRAGAIRDVLRQDGVSRAWEANIRYRNCFTYDNNLALGMPYRIVDGKLEPAPPELDDSVMAQFKEIFKEDENITRVIEEYAPLFFTEVPDIRRLAVDIEVYTPVKNRVPDANTSPYPVTAIGLSDNEDFHKCLVLRRKDIDEGTKKADFPPALDIAYFDSEADMLVEAFRIIDQYPIVLTFVGDAFDLNYMYHRAERLKIDMDRYCPIRMGRGNEIALLGRGVHIDLYRFLKNPSIRLYALSAAYERTNLDSIAQGLLGIGKLDLSTDISSLPYYELAHYCWLDANITLRITSYNNNLLLRLIILLMRISRLSMEDVTRLGISSWIQSLFRQEHRSRGNLIPRPADIETMKSSDAQTEAMIKDKRFKGAIVIEPVAGVHFNATVLDFASLYPTIMKRHNISYETVDCPHEECRIAENNRVPETDHWICTKRTGMISQIIGFFRDTRVDWFKSKSKDKSLEERTRNWYTVVEKALKVFVNACLPFEEEVVVRSSDGYVTKCKIG